MFELITHEQLWREHGNAFLHGKGLLWGPLTSCTSVLCLQFLLVATCFLCRHWNMNVLVASLKAKSLWDSCEAFWEISEVAFAHTGSYPKLLF